jgi:CRP-like cAMP-binding protein
MKKRISQNGPAAADRGGTLNGARPRPDVARDEQRREGSPAPLENQLLMLLPREARVRLASHLEIVHFERHQVLCHAHEALTHVYFPTSAVVSLVSRVESGHTLEVALIGREGVVGVGVCPGVDTMACDAIAQIAGDAYRLDAHVLHREFMADSSIYPAFARYAELLFVRCVQMAACNMFHAVEQRLVRWLLMVHDLTGHDEIPVTHELVAAMLGVHRPTVTLVLGTLHRTGVIHEERGRILVSDRARLERSCCECYGVLRAEQRRLLGY